MIVIYSYSGVDFSSNGKPLSLSIHLPPEYPNVRPNVYVEPKGISHPWIREDGLVVGAPGLIRYAQQTDLGRLVQVTGDKSHIIYLSLVNTDAFPGNQTRT